MMQELLEKAKQAASQVVGDVSDARHVETLVTGEHVFEVAGTEADSRAVVTLNPNGRGAGVEWRHKTRGSGYRVFKIQGLVAADHIEMERVP